MTQDELFSKVSVKFPKLEKASVQVKAYLTLRLAVPADLPAVAAWLRDEAGFNYLDIVTAVDYRGPVDAKGFVMNPNPNAFLPEGATPQVEAPTPAAGYPYRDAMEIVYCFTHLQERLKLFLKLEVPRAAPSVPSLTPLFKAADWQEREAFDLLGVSFEGHPNLTKILTPEFMQGHPLRKDYIHVADRFD